jgi:hypothetical protein
LGLGAELSVLTISQDGVLRRILFPGPEAKSDVYDEHSKSLQSKKAMMNNGVCLSERNLKAIKDNENYQCMKPHLRQITSPEGLVLVVLANNRRLLAECKNFPRLCNFGIRLGWQWGLGFWWRLWGWVVIKLFPAWQWSWRP